MDSILKLSPPLDCHRVNQTEADHTTRGPQYGGLDATQLKRMKELQAEVSQSRACAFCYDGVRFRTFNVIDHFNREGLAIEIDTSLTGGRLIRVFEQLQAERGLPTTLRVDNGPEFLGADSCSWASLDRTAVSRATARRSAADAVVGSRGRHADKRRLRGNREACVEGS
jgi:transposase InsO family protein